MFSDDVVWISKWKLLKKFKIVSRRIYNLIDIIYSRYWRLLDLVLFWSMIWRTRQQEIVICCNYSRITYFVKFVDFSVNWMLKAKFVSNWLPLDVKLSYKELTAYWTDRTNWEKKADFKHYKHGHLNRHGHGLVLLEIQQTIGASRVWN